MTRQERLDAIAAAFDRWTEGWERRVQPERRYVHPGPSQYPEHVVTVSAPAAAQAELVELIGPAGIAT